MPSHDPPRRHKRLNAEQRAEAVKKIKERYEAGDSIRVIAERLDRSYGWVHTQLVEADVELRKRGSQPKKPPRPKSRKSA